jgi:hypothetical protein
MNPESLIIPTLPPKLQELFEIREMPGGKKHYHMHTVWHDFFSQLTTTLQQVLSQEGLSIPKQPTTTINSLTAAQSVGAFLYDNTTNEMKVNLNVGGTTPTWKTITTS